MSLAAASVMSMPPLSLHTQHPPQHPPHPDSSDAPQPQQQQQQQQQRHVQPKSIVASHVLRGHVVPVVSVLHSKDGSVYSAAADGEIRFWRAADGVCKAVGTEHKGKVTSLSRLGKVLVSGGSDGTVHLWDTELCRLRGSLPGHTGGVTAVAGAKNGSPLLFTGDASGVVHVADIPSCSERAHYACHSAPVTALAARRDGSLFSAAADGSVCAWSDALVCAETLAGHTDSVLTLALSADESRLFSASLDGTVRRWDVSARAQDTASTRGDAAGVICRYPPGQRVAKMVLSADGLRMWTGHEDGYTRVWSTVSGACTAESRGHDGRLTALALSRTEELLATASEDGSVRLCSAETLRCHAVAAPSLDCSPVTALALSKDCTELWTGCGDGHLRRFRLGPAGFSRVACLNLTGVVGSSQYRLPGCVPANLSSAVGFLVGAAQEKLSVYTVKAGHALRAGYLITRDGAARGLNAYIGPTHGGGGVGAAGQPSTSGRGFAGDGAAQQGAAAGAAGGGAGFLGGAGGDGSGTHSNSRRAGNGGGAGGDDSEGDDLILELPVSGVGGAGGGGQPLHPL